MLYHPLKLLAFLLCVSIDYIVNLNPSIYYLKKKEFLNFLFLKRSFYLIYRFLNVNVIYKDNNK